MNQDVHCVKIASWKYYYHQCNENFDVHHLKKMHNLHEQFFFMHSQNQGLNNHTSSFGSYIYMFIFECLFA